MLVQILALPKRDKLFSIRGRGYASLIVTSLRGRESQPKCKHFSSLPSKCRSTIIIVMTVSCPKQGCCGLLCWRAFCFFRRHPLYTLTVCYTRKLYLHRMFCDFTVTDVIFEFQKEISKFIQNLSSMMRAMVPHKFWTSLSSASCPGIRASSAGSVFFVSRLVSPLRSIACGNTSCASVTGALNVSLLTCACAWYHTGSIGAALRSTFMAVRSSSFLAGSVQLPMRRQQWPRLSPVRAHPVETSYPLSFQRSWWFCQSLNSDRQRMVWIWCLFVLPIYCTGWES